MCDSWKIKRGAELTALQVREVFARIGTLDVARLTGGEPFLRDDFAAAAQREWVDACGGCWAECEVMPSALYSGDIVREVFYGR